MCNIFDEQIGLVQRVTELIDKNVSLVNMATTDKPSGTEKTVKRRSVKDTVTIVTTCDPTDRRKRQVVTAIWTVEHHPYLFQATDFRLKRKRPVEGKNHRA